MMHQEPPLISCALAVLSLSLLYGTVGGQALECLLTPLFEKSKKKRNERRANIGLEEVNANFKSSSF